MSSFLNLSFITSGRHLAEVPVATPTIVFDLFIISNGQVGASFVSYRHTSFKKKTTVSIIIKCEGIFFLVFALFPWHCYIFCLYFKYSDHKIIIMLKSLIRVLEGHLSSRASKIFHRLYHASFPSSDICGICTQFSIV